MHIYIIKDLNLNIFVSVPVITVQPTKRLNIWSRSNDMTEIVTTKQNINKINQ